MLNKIKFFNLILIFLIAHNLYSLSIKNNEKKSYSKYEYDLADYLPNVNGRCDVFINEVDDSDCYVEMYFYTSMYQIYYFISFNESSFKGFAEKIIYEEAYNLNNSTKEYMGTFEGKKTDLSGQSDKFKKYISLAIELLNESIGLKKAP